MKERTLIVLFNLKDGVSEKEYEKWAKEVDIPIADAVYRILHERMSPVLEMRLLSDNLS